jgi:hypothetical protein
VFRAFYNGGGVDILRTELVALAQALARDGKAHEKEKIRLTRVMKW